MSSHNIIQKYSYLVLNIAQYLIRAFFLISENSAGFKMASSCKMRQKTINNKKTMLSLKIFMASIQAKIDHLPSNHQKRMLL